MQTPLAFMLSSLNSTLSAILKSGDAYLDPGSGSFILQLLIASLVGAAFIIKTYWRRINAFFRQRFNKDQNEEEE
jgi:drug/metabolite transporter (DMT)-like permease